jgi:major membrane immunogen (membrane-anchored lipoprotein)
MKTTLNLGFAAFLLFGCGFVEDMKGMFEKSQLVTKAIKDKHGWDTQVGWNMHNGRLTQVTVMFQSKEVRELKVAMLENAALEAIGKAFASKPEVVLVQIANQQGN